MRQQLHVRVYGEVQGVGFRAFTVRQADHLGLDGWVRNCPEGQVEVVAQAGREKLERFLEALRRGPRHSTVREVRSQWSDPEEELIGFTVRW